MAVTISNIDEEIDAIRTILSTLNANKATKESQLAVIDNRIKKATRKLIALRNIKEVFGHYQNEGEV